eukprot:3505143-Pleurochrysis_carterae.AAC.1
MSGAPAAPTAHVAAALLRIRIMRSPMDVSACKRIKVGGGQLVGGDESRASMILLSNPARGAEIERSDAEARQGRKGRKCSPILVSLPLPEGVGQRWDEKNAKRSPREEVGRSDHEREIKMSKGGKGAFENAAI